jgi:hypothetical protein
LQEIRQGVRIALVGALWGLLEVREEVGRHLADALARLDGGKGAAQVAAPAPKHLGDGREVAVRGSHVPAPIFRRPLAPVDERVHPEAPTPDGALVPDRATSGVEVAER